jgi:hypothetical protein
MMDNKDSLHISPSASFVGIGVTFGLGWRRLMH